MNPTQQIGYDNCTTEQQKEKYKAKLMKKEMRKFTLHCVGFTEKVSVKMKMIVSLTVNFAIF